jgi:hypothetical protein
MSNELSNELKKQIFSQESSDPFLTLVTLTHVSFTARLVNNTSDITSRGFTFYGVPMKVNLPADDGETAREFTITFDNVSLELITQMRSVTGNIGVKFEMILASIPNVVQMSFEDLIIKAINYDARSIVAKISMDSFLIVEMTSEKYTPNTYPGLF